MLCAAAIYLLLQASLTLCLSVSLFLWRLSLCLPGARTFVYIFVQTKMQQPVIQVCTKVYKENIAQTPVPKRNTARERKRVKVNGNEGKHWQNICGMFIILYAVMLTRFECAA